MPRYCSRIFGFDRGVNLHQLLDSCTTIAFAWTKTSECRYHSFNLSLQAKLSASWRQHLVSQGMHPMAQSIRSTNFVIDSSRGNTSYSKWGPLQCSGGLASSLTTYCTTVLVQPNKWQICLVIHVYYLVLPTLHYYRYRVQEFDFLVVAAEWHQLWHRDLVRQIATIIGSLHFSEKMPYSHETNGLKINPTIWP
jgi:hypothetical protein